MNDVIIDVAALAKLAKLEVSAEELARLKKEIPEILGFVEAIQNVSGTTAEESPAHRNAMREDVNPHETGLHTRDLLDAAPAQKDDQIAVKQVLNKA